MGLPLGAIHDAFEAVVVEVVELRTLGNCKQGEQGKQPREEWACKGVEKRATVCYRGTSSYTHGIDQPHLLPDSQFGSSDQIASP